MKGLGVVLVLGVLLACVLGFAYWLRTHNPMGLRLHAAVDRGLEQIDPTGEQVLR